MNLSGSPQEIQAQMIAKHPELITLMENIYKRVIQSKREMYPYQACVLYHLARQYDSSTDRALELGSAFGYSATFLANAMPGAQQIITLNPKGKEYHHAVRALLPYQQASVVMMNSWDYLKIYDGPPFQLIFVDGDHEQVRRDVPWFNHLVDGGLILFHDYTPDGAKRPCQPVFEAVNELGRKLGRHPDVKVIDSRGAGMVGFYRNGEVL